jgi:hypothetical protein
MEVQKVSGTVHQNKQIQKSAFSSILSLFEKYLPFWGTSLGIPFWSLGLGLLSYLSFGFYFQRKRVGPKKDDNDKDSSNNNNNGKGNFTSSPTKSLSIYCSFDKFSS